MNPDTLVAVCCYAGDRHQVATAMPLYEHHGTSVVIFSPTDSRVVFKRPKLQNVHVGRAAYIGQMSLNRQRKHLEILKNSRYKYFLLHDSDSFCLTPKLPDVLYQDDNTIWSNEVTEPRPHASPYPKIAMQPPYFFSKNAAIKMLNAAHNVMMHPVTPYIDWWTVAVSCEAGLKHRPFTDLEHVSRCDQICMSDDPWETLRYRIKFQGSTFMHPIKTPEQVKLCVDARKFYES